MGQLRARVILNLFDGAVIVCATLKATCEQNQTVALLFVFHRHQAQAKLAAVIFGTWHSVGQHLEGVAFFQLFFADL